jgi:hypothetical protein
VTAIALPDGTSKDATLRPCTAEEIRSPDQAFDQQKQFRVIRGTASESHRPDAHISSTDKESLMFLRKSLLIASLSLVLGAGAALADETRPGEAVPAQAEAPAQGAAAEVKAAKGVENKEPVEEGTSFAAGDKVWVWSRITGAANTTVRHVWKKNGQEIWSANLPVKGNRWTTSSRRTVQPGQYVVEVQGQDGSVLGSVSFDVQ